MIEVLRILNKKIKTFEDESVKILSRNESSKTRIISLEQTRTQLKELSIKQEELFREAFTCIESGIYRAAHVMAWAAFMDFLEQKLASDGLVKLKSVRTSWGKYNTIEEMRESVPEYQFIEAAHDVKLLLKSETKTLLGLLSKRNECAHPTNYHTNLNESLGYVSELFNRIKQLNLKSL